jgi:hypothetical protein
VNTYSGKEYIQFTAFANGDNASAESGFDAAYSKILPREDAIKALREKAAQALMQADELERRPA